jgi:CHAD domain-containing protein
MKSTATDSTPPSLKAGRAEQKPRPRRGSLPKLHAEMACDTAFRVIARSCLEDLTASHLATCASDATALHDMRIAFTRLRAAISFFSPMVVDAGLRGLKRELKWLNTQLGAARDIDVAIERLRAIAALRQQPISDEPLWARKRAHAHRELAQALGSARYRRLIKDLRAWIETGPWCIAAGKHLERRRACPIMRYSTGKLALWREKLLRKARRLKAMGASKRHRVRLANKRLRYSIEFFAGLLSDQTASVPAALTQLRKAQQALGELNDAVIGQALLQRNTGEGSDFRQFRDRKRERKLLRRAIRAYRKMDQIGPICR